MVDLDGRHSDIVTHFLRQVTLSPHDADFKGGIFRIYPPSLTAFALIFFEFRGGGEGGEDKKIGLNRVINALSAPFLSKIRFYRTHLAALNVFSQIAKKRTIHVAPPKRP